MSKTAAKKIERLEAVAIGAGFLLKKLRSQYGKSFGDGMWQQVNACINDCEQVARNQAARQTKEAHQPSGTEGGAV